MTIKFKVLDANSRSGEGPLKAENRLKCQDLPYEADSADFGRLFIFKCIKSRPLSAVIKVAINESLIRMIIQRKCIWWVFFFTGELV